MSEPIDRTHREDTPVTSAPGVARTTAGEAPPAEVFLQPIAAPSILGLFGFAGATFMVAAFFAHWFGPASAQTILFPFAAFFGGLAQFLAGMWAFKARDGLATAMHGTWGSFWMAYGLLWAFVASGKLHLPGGAHGLNGPLGYWFIVLAIVTWLGAVGALARNLGLTAVLALLAAGSTAAAVANLIGSDKWMVLGGWLFIASAACAFYTAGAMMINREFGREVMPLYEFEREKQAPRTNVGIGEPGVMHGQ